MNRHRHKHQRQPQQPKTVNIPRQVNIAGGVTLKAMPFKIVAYNDDGTPKLFELQPAGPHDMAADHACVLFAQEEWIRAPRPGKLAPTNAAPPDDKYSDWGGKH